MTADNEEFQISEEVTDRAYFALIPNMIDDLPLSVYAYRIYGHLKRVTGENGRCWQSQRSLAERCGMSVHAVVNAKKELLDHGLIKIALKKTPGGGKDYHEIIVVDIWERNISTYKESQGTTSTLQGTGGTSQGTVVHLKKNSLRRTLKKNPNKGHTPPGSSGFSENEKPDEHLIINHPTIQSLKGITGRFPKKDLWDLIVNTFPILDVLKARSCYLQWVGQGYNPENYDWLLDWYPNNRYYTDPRDKERWDAVTIPEEASLDE